MNYLFSFCFFSLIIIALSPLQPFKWKNRIILLSGQDSIVVEQLNRYKKYMEDVKERNILIIYSQQNKFKIFPAGNHPKISFQETVKYYKLSDKFSSLLIGKDGGIKSKDDTLLLPNTYFAQIDGMPMRQQEIRNKQKHK
jgi:hypothetical protein